MHDRSQSAKHSNVKFTHAFGAVHNTEVHSHNVKVWFVQFRGVKHSMSAHGSVGDALGDADGLEGAMVGSTVGKVGERLGALLGSLGLVLGACVVCVGLVVV